MRKNQLRKNNSVVLFDDTPVRRIWIEKEEKWYFVIADIVKILAESNNPTGYIKDMRRRDGELSKGWGQIATPLKVETKGGKQKVNCSDIQGVLRIIQSIPSKKAEPFKRWLAKVGYERIKETVDPEISMNRARENWLAMGHSKKWVEQRMRGQETRNKLTDYWKKSGVKEGVEYAKLTDIIHTEWSGLTTKEHKILKRLKGHNLRDNMTDAELIFTALAELSTNEVAKKDDSKGFGQNAVSAKKGGGVAKKAKENFEKIIGKKVVSQDNFLPPLQVKKQLRK